MTGSRSSSSPTGDERPGGEDDATIVESPPAEPSSVSANAQSHRALSPRELWAELDGLPDIILPGTTLGRYVVLEVVGRGAMGTVARAYDPRLRREVAVKRLRPRKSPEEGETRLVREARAMAQLNHPNVVAVYDVDTQPWGVLIAMEYVRGPTLREWLRTRRSPREIIDAFRQAGTGLAAAHAAGLVHRDFKPANVLVEESPGSQASGRVRVTDFGLARVQTSEPMAAAESSEDLLDSVDPRDGEPLTLAGVVMGTPLYMAPEQHRGETAGPPADQYAFCVALWEALAGMRPFEATDIDALVRRKLEGPPPWPRSLDVPARILHAIRRGLAADPNERFPTMDALVAALADDPIRAVRRRTFAAAGAVTAVSAALAIAGWQRAQASLCSGAQEQLADAWNAERRAAAQTAILATNQPYAPATWTVIAPGLDTYAADWVRMHTESCAATSVRGEQSAAVLDLRMACLQRARSQLRSVTDMLVRADEAVVLHAHSIVDGLPAIDRCADVVALQSDVAPPDDPAVARDVESIRDELADAKALTHVGKPKAALERIDELVARSEAFDYPPLGTELALARGQALMGLGRFADAETVLRAALREALQIGQLEQAGWLASGLTLVVGDRLSRASEGLAYADVAIGIAESEAGGPAAQASARNNLANVLVAQGRYAEAEAEHRRILAMRIELHGGDHYDVATSRLNLGNALTNQGKLTEAEAEIASALAILRARLGDDHPEVAAAHGNLGGVFLSDGRNAEAEAEFREALRIRLATLGPEHVGVAEARGNLGNVLKVQGRLDEAEAELRATVTGIEAGLGRAHPNAAIAHNNLGSLLQSAGRAEDAESEYATAVAIATDALGPNHPLTLTFRHNIAGARSDSGRIDDAETEFRAVLALRIEALGAEHPEVARTWVSLGTTLLQAGRLADATAAYREGAALWERAHGPDSVEIADALVGLGQALARQGRDADARPELQRAYDLRRAHQVDAEQRGEAAFALAQVLWSTPAERDRALQLGREAKEQYATVMGTRADAPRREVARWLESPAPHERGTPDR